MRDTHNLNMSVTLHIRVYVNVRSFEGKAGHVVEIAVYPLLYLPLLNILCVDLS